MPDASSMIQRVRFASAGGECDATLYRPAGSTSAAPWAVVVLAHGLGGHQDERLDAYAARFAEHGYAALTFDYRHFGASTGEPRQLVDTGRQAADLRNAVAFVRTVEDVDPERVIVWGTSLGAGHAMAVAAADPRLAAVVVQAPFVDGSTAMRATPLRASLRIMPLALRDRWAASRGRPPVRLPIVGAPGQVAVMTSPDSVPGLRRILEASGKPYAVAEIPARFMLQVPRYRPGRDSSKIQAPLLVCVCTRDRVTPAAMSEQVALRAPKGEVTRYDADHFAIYVGELWEAVVSDQIAFMKRHVPVQSTV